MSLRTFIPPIVSDLIVYPLWMLLEAEVALVAPRCRLAHTLATLFQLPQAEPGRTGLNDPYIAPVAWLATKTNRTLFWMRT